MAYITSEAQDFARSRETSDEIAQAILDLNSERGPKVVWETPTAEEMAEVAAAAFEMTDEDDLQWGIETIHRPVNA